MPRYFTILSLVIVSLFSGCGGKEKTVLLKVNGVPLYKESVEQEAALKFCLFQNISPLKDPKKEEKAREGLYKSVLKGKLTEMLLFQVSKGTAVPDEKVKASEKRYFDVFRGKFPDRGAFETHLKKSGVYSAYRARIAAETQIDSFLTKNYTSELSISDELVESTIGDMKRGNERADATNVFIYATASNVWKRAASGEDFAALARKYSNMIDTDTDGDIGENCDFNDFKGEDISIWNAVSKLMPGEVTPPLSTSEGLTIYKCHEREEDPDYEGGVRYHLARIVFFRALTYENFDPKFVRKELEKEARGKVVSSILTTAYKTVKVEFPNGERDLPKGFMKGVDKLIEGAKNGTN